MLDWDIEAHVKNNLYYFQKLRLAQELFNKNTKKISKTSYIISKRNANQLNEHTSQSLFCSHGPKVACNSETGCPCALRGFCQKFCGCNEVLCRIRYKGCSCISNCRTDICPCKKSDRSCDPDVCSS